LRPPMRVLYATPRPPIPPHLGDQLIAYEQIKHLATRVELHVVSLINTPAEDSPASVPSCAGVYLMRHPRQRRNAARSLYNGRPVLVNLFFEPRHHTAIRQIVERVRPHLIHVQTIHMAEYFKDLRIPRVLDMVDSMSANLAARAQREPWPRSLVYRWEATRLLRYERAMLSRFDQVVLVSAADAARYDGARVHVNPNGTFVTPERVAAWKGASKEFALLFHGNMDYFANGDAVRWFSRSVWPALRDEHPHLRLYIVGRSPPASIRALHDGTRVIVTGAVGDVLEYLARCTVGVYPLATGSGAPNKILEALAAALPAVVSPLAIAGLPHLHDGDQVLVARTPREWIAHTSQLLRDPALRARCAQRGQETVWTHHSWARNAAFMEELWRATAGNSTARTPGPRT
jgi:sugar transferase (PEP-CTERM/EpsH1 system associated)